MGKAGRMEPGNLLVEVKMSHHMPLDTKIVPKSLALCTYAVGLNDWDEHDYFEEFKSLVKTAGIPVSDTVLLKMRQVDPTYFFTKGKLQEIVNLCSEGGVEQLVLSSSLTGIQHRNLETAVGATIIDRTDLILGIFKNAAVSAEGKLQVEIAEIKIAKTGLVGLGKEMGQQQAGVGSRGPGETEKEYLYRHYSELILKAEKKLKALSSTRDVQRKRRLKCGLPLVSLVGYTNAGKSSIINALARADVLAEDKLFATLDTTTKEVFLAVGKKLLLSDTVGFISELPHHLINAFETTLDELRYAHLLLCVVDSSSSSWPKQVEVVSKTLSDLGVAKRVVYVFNKVDRLSKEELQQLKHTVGTSLGRAVFVSALSHDGLLPLKDMLINDDVLWSIQHVE